MDSRNISLNNIQWTHDIILSQKLKFNFLYYGFFFLSSNQNNGSQILKIEKKIMAINPHCHFLSTNLFSLQSLNFFTLSNFGFLLQTQILNNLKNREKKVKFYMFFKCNQGGGQYKTFQVLLYFKHFYIALFFSIYNFE